MRLSLYTLILLSTFWSYNLFSADIRSTTQYISIKRPGKNQEGKQQDLQGKLNLNRKLSLGLNGTYLERFGLYEKRAGLSVGIKPSEKWNLELGLKKGNGNEILPETEKFFQSYYAWQEGLTPFLIYRDASYSVTRLHSLNLGLEIEKFPKIIFIPMFLVGKATFSDPAKTKDVMSYGFRLTHYTEQKYSFSVFSSKGKEASQGVLGRSTRLIDTLSGGLAVAYYIDPDMKAELAFDHTDYDQLKTQFQTTVLNLTWML